MFLIPTNLKSICAVPSPYVYVRNTSEAIVPDESNRLAALDNVSFFY
jgi:hypothetical protein